MSKPTLPLRCHTAFEIPHCPTAGPRLQPGMQTCAPTYLRVLQKQELAVTGRNWGHAAVEGSTLVFTENGKTTFRIPLSDVGQVEPPSCS